MNYRELIDYYNIELDYLRQAGGEFARKFPRIAQRLELQSTESPDPHVERLIEAFAFLTARIHRRLDDDFSEFSEALISNLLPQYLAPIPSHCIAWLQMDPAQNRASEGQLVTRHTSIFSKAVSGAQCTFRTSYDVTLWPITVSSARVTSPSPDREPPPRARSVLSIKLQMPPRMKFSELRLKTLRFYLHGNERQSNAIYDFLMNQVSRIDVALHAGKPQLLARMAPETTLAPVGLEPEDSLLPAGNRSLTGHQLLMEYFAFPQKFLFVDVNDLEPVIQMAHGGTLELLFYSESSFPNEAAALDESCFRLGCTPAVNLFRRSAEPILLTQTRHEYNIIPDRFRQNATEVYSIERVRGVTGASKAQGSWFEYHPFYSTSHAESGLYRDCYWYATRRLSNREGDPGTELYLSFVNLEFDPKTPSVESVVVDTLCSNRDLPGRLPFGESGDRSDFQMEGLPAVSIFCLTKPTPTCRPKLGKAAQWRLISSLLVNLQGILDPANGREVLKELLTLYEFSGTQANRQHISGIHAISGSRIVARVEGPRGEVGMARGTEVVIEFDPENYVGSSVYLFASILERFMAQQVSLNSFCKLSVKMKGQGGYFKRWKPRLGNQPGL